MVSRPEYGIEKRVLVSRIFTEWLNRHRPTRRRVNSSFLFAGRGQLLNVHDWQISVSLIGADVLIAERWPNTDGASAPGPCRIGACFNLRRSSLPVALARGSRPCWNTRFELRIAPGLCREDAGPHRSAGTIFSSLTGPFPLPPSPRFCPPVSNQTPSRAQPGSAWSPSGSTASSSAACPPSPACAAFPISTSAPTCATASLAPRASTASRSTPAILSPSLLPV